MPKRTDLHKILLIGSGPIVIGQACEFDYSGTQACKALKEEGYRIILVNSNPATIMTDPEFADRTYIEPLTPETLEQIIEREKPDALLPTVGGQTGINLASALWEAGILQKHGVRRGKGPQRRIAQLRLAADHLHPKSALPLRLAGDGHQRERRDQQEGEKPPHGSVVFTRLMHALT